MKCIFATTIFKNEGYLKKAFDNLKQLTDCFNQYKILVCYDNSGDKSLKELCELKNEGWDIEIIFNPKDRFLNGMGRAYNIGQARNQLIELIYDKYMDYDYFCMCDLDDVFCNEIYIDNFKKYIPEKYDPDNPVLVLDEDENIDGWDALSFYNECYYDWWALSIGKYQDSCWHVDDPEDRIDNMRGYLEYHTKDKNMIKVDSAFNGFCIHKLNKFSKYRYKPASIVDNKIFIDCEHRQYYKSATADGLNIMMSVAPLFSKMDNISHNNKK